MTQTIFVVILWFTLMIFFESFSIETLVYSLSFLFLNILKIYLKNKNFIKSFLKLKKNELKRQNQEIFVSHLLPLHVIFYLFIIIKSEILIKTFEKLKQIENNQKIDLTDSFDQATLLFADIVNFTKLASEIPPIAVVQILRELFEEFDKICFKHQVYKVHTIGDCYVVLGVLNAFRRNPSKEARNVLEMAIDMIKVIKDIRAKTGFSDLDMRIAIHSV